MSLAAHRSVGFVAFAMALCTTLAAACLTSEDDPPQPSVATDAASEGATPDGAIPDATEHETAHAEDGGHDGDAHDPDAHDAGHSCSNFGVVGTAPACLFSAKCVHGNFDLDCRDSGTECACIGPDGGVVIVPYQSLFCGISDAGSPATVLDRALIAAHTACGYTHY